MHAKLILLCCCFLLIQCHRKPQIESFEFIILGLADYPDTASTANNTGARMYFKFAGEVDSMIIKHKPQLDDGTYDEATYYQLAVTDTLRKDVNDIIKLLQHKTGGQLHQPLRDGLLYCGPSNMICIKYQGQEPKVFYFINHGVDSLLEQFSEYMYYLPLSENRKITAAINTDSIVQHYLNTNTFPDIEHFKQQRSTIRFSPPAITPE